MSSEPNPLTGAPGLAGCGTPAQAADAVRAWIEAEIPPVWRAAAEREGTSGVRSVRTQEEYRAWYPVFGRSGLVVPRWPVEYGGLGWPRELAEAAERELRPYHLPRLNPLGLNLAAPALFEHGSREQRLRFLPGIAAMPRQHA